MISLLSALVVALPLAWIAYELRNLVQISSPSPVTTASPATEPLANEAASPATIPEQLQAWINLESEGWARDEMRELALLYYTELDDWAQVEGLLRRTYGKAAGWDMLHVEQD